MTPRAFRDIHQAERDTLLQAIVTAIRRDDRVIAAWLGGSIGRGTDDWLSDLDLWIAVRDDAIEAIRADPRRFVTSIVMPALIIEQPGNAAPDGAYLFTHVAGESGPHQIDWYWLPASTARRPATSRLLFDRADIPLAPPPPTLTDEEARERLTLVFRNLIAMVAIAGKSVLRGWTLQTAGNVRTVYQLLAEIEWLLEHNTAPEYDDIKERVRDMPVPASADDAFAELADLLVHAESLRGCFVERGISWPDESLAQIRMFLLALRDED